MRQDELKERARKFILDLKKMELEPDQTIIESSPGELIEDGAGEPLQYQTEVAIRRFFADITVRLDAETGQLLSWIIPERYRGADETTISEEQLKQMASEAIEIPVDAEIEELVQEQEPDSHISNILWSHFVNGLEVEGDFISVQINSKTKAVISLAKLWNAVKDHECKISREDAEQIARRRAPEYVETSEYEITVNEQKFIPVVVDESAPRPQARMVKVWMSNIFEPDEHFPRITKLSIDCLTGDIVRVERSM